MHLCSKVHILTGKYITYDMIMYTLIGTSYISATMLRVFLMPEEMLRVVHASLGRVQGLGFTVWLLS